MGNNGVIALDMNSVSAVVDKVKGDANNTPQNDAQ
jgi:hypothetical protein